jgi:aquaporin NIP
MITLHRKLLSECIGTFAMVFCGTGAIVINQVSGGAITHAGIAITFGLIVASMIFALGDVSGAHMNPAVTLAFWSAGRFSRRDVFPYVLSQIAGAIAASLLLKFLFSDNQMLGATIPSGSAMQSFVLEVILSFLLVLVIFNVSSGAKEKGITAAIAIGGTVGLEALFAGPISGASMNPVRSLGPAVVSGYLSHLWIYILAPVLGAFAAVFIHQILYPKKHAEQSENLL